MVDKQLTDLRKYAKENFIPVLKEDAAIVLEEWLQKLSPKRVLEIGTSIGTSGILTLSKTQATLTTIEIDEDTFLEARKNFVLAGFLERVEMINGDCFKVLMLMSKSFDFIILDGPKSHNLELLEFVYPMLTEGGAIFVDNIGYHNKVKAEKVEHKHRTIVTNTRKFLDYILASKQMKVTLYDLGDGIAVIEKL